MKKSEYGKVIKGVSNIIQLGITMITPILLCIFGAIYFKNKFSLDNGIIIIGIIVGISAGMLNLYKLAKLWIKEANAQKGKYDSVKLRKYDEDKDE